jgi:hypothetical protein
LCAQGALTGDLHLLRVLLTRFDACRESRIIEHVFEKISDAVLIDAMVDATRDESAMIAQRLAAVGELDARRAVELAERNLWTLDPFHEVAAEISAAQNISRGRAGNQIHLARALRDDLPCVAKVFATGAIDYRMVAMIIERTENVDPSRAQDWMPRSPGTV